MINRFIIDGFNLAFRAHYAFRNFKTSTGLPSGCLYGFLNILKSLKNKYANFQFVIAWDSESKRKKALFPEYKANRVHFSIDSNMQDLMEALRYINVLQVDSPGEEADDVIATLAQKPDNGLVIIYSSDKDLLQLVRDKVIVIRPKVGGTPERFYDEEAVKQEFGVYPRDLACLLALKGDSVDNISGVSRVPSKVLAGLVSKYHEPEVIYQKLSEEKLTDFQHRNIVASENQVLVNYGLTTLKKDLYCTTIFGKSNEKELGRLLTMYEITSIVPDTYVQIFNRDTSFLIRTDDKPFVTESVFG